MNFKLPKGTYFLGDPCYAIQDDERWQEVVNRMYDGSHNKDADVMVVPSKSGKSDAKIFYGSTAYGDGRYEDQNGNEFPVDAGMIGLVPMSIAEPEGMNLSKCGKIVNFETDVFVEWDDGYFFISGDNQTYKIDTGDAESGEDESEEQSLDKSVN